MAAAPAQPASEYQRTEALRTHLQLLKKSMNALGPVITPYVRLKKTAPPGGDEEAARRHRIRLAKTKKSLAELVKNITDLRAGFEGHPRWQAIVDWTAAEATKDFPGEEEFAKFTMELKQRTVLIFREEGELLKRMQELRRRGAGPATPASGLDTAVRNDDGDVSDSEDED